MIKQRKNGRLYFYSAVAITLCGMLIGCQTSQQKASRELERDLSQRQADRSDSMQRYHSAIADYYAGALDDAKRGLREAVDLNDRNLPAWNALGVVAFHQGEFRTAVEGFQRAARLAPDSYEPRFNLGTVYESIGRYPEAIVEYEAALVLAPPDASDLTQIRENLARAYVRNGTEPARALELIGLALEYENRVEWRRWLELEAIRLEYKLNPDVSVLGVFQDSPPAVMSSDKEVGP